MPIKRVLKTKYQKYFLAAFIFCIPFSNFSWGQNKWVDSIFNKLTLEEKITQLMIIRVPSDENDKTYAQALEHIQKGAGGICFFAGKAENHLRLTKHFQKEAKVPLFVSIDGEWGLGMRQTDGYSFPRQMMLGALQGEELVFQMGKEIAVQCKRMGFNINYAPTCDINTNPKNPVIGNRSFGEDKLNVTKKSLAYMEGLQQNGVMAVAKHFPGHGDTDVDSHSDLPVVNHSKRRMQTVELFPFKELIKNGIDGIMIAHLHIPAYDSTPNLPSSLSSAVIEDLLKKELRYPGLVFTDGLEMRGVTKNFKDGKAELFALQAGNDILLLPVNVQKAIETIAKAAANDAFLLELINKKCKHVLERKYAYGLHKKLDIESLTLPSADDIKRATALTKEITQKSITLIQNKNEIIPVKSISDVRIAFFDLYPKPDNLLKTYLERYYPVDYYSLTKLPQKEIDSMLRAVSLYDYCIVASYEQTSNPQRVNYGFSKETLDLLDKIVRNKGKSKLIAGIFGSPYILDTLSCIKDIDALFVGYQNIPEMCDAFSQAIFGGIETKGKLSVSSNDFDAGFGMGTKKVRLAYKVPEQIQIPFSLFDKIDSIATNGITAKAYPGCQILIAKAGDIIYNKSFGQYTYESGSPKVTDSTIYDVASVTKIAATTLAIMKLVDDGLININDPLSKYLPYLSKKHKKITIKETLSHVAGFKSYTPFWRSLMKDKAAMDNLFAKAITNSTDYYPLGDSLFVKKHYREALLDSIANSPLNEPNKYVYSDFGFILLGDLIEHVTGQPLDSYLDNVFYNPLGMHRTTFNPLQNGVSKELIAPTENDTLFRKSLVRGIVHDPTAALMGGVAGHAGLFSTAEDLAKLYQMILNGGNYGGTHYLSESVIRKFNERYYKKENVRRALGFDKRSIKGKDIHVSSSASQSSFGHTGFTGTMVWIDPEYDLIYIFLSNRVHPNAEPNRLAAMNIRTLIQDEIYRGILNPKGNY